MTFGSEAVEFEQADPMSEPTTSETIRLMVDTRRTDERNFTNLNDTPCPLR
jgi:hypothetical protein